jgi:TolB-like protein
MRFSCKVYEFGDFRLDVTRRLLQSKTGSRPLPLTAKAFETLLYLVEHAGELLDKSSLMQAVWPDVVVEENNLNQNISLLRRLLGECPGEYRYIVTVPGQGYRFVASVHTVIDAAHRRAGDSEPLPELRTRTAVAVLPFVDLTGDPANGQLGTSLAEELINTLARLRWFTVPARASCFAYRGANVDARRIARELDVDAVLEGTIQTAEQNIRVTAQLVDGRLGHHLWSESFDRAGANPARLRDELTIAIVDAISGHFILGTTARRAPTRDLEAFHLYLRAIALRNQPTKHNLMAAIDLLERASARDKEFARAWYVRADARMFAAANDFGGGELLEQAERDARHSLALDNTLSGAHGVLGVLSACRAKWIDAEAQFSEARALLARNPETLVYHAAYVSRQVGHRRRALEEAQSAYEMAPASAALAFQVGVQRLMNGDNLGARRWIDVALANGYPLQLGTVREARALLAAREGRSAAATQELAEGLSAELRAAGGFEVIQSFDDALADASRRAAAIVRLQGWLDGLDIRHVDRLTLQRSMIWFTLLGAVDAAHDLAARTLDSLASSGMPGCGWGILWIDEMKAFRASARFHALALRLGLTEYWRQYGPPDGCAIQEGALVAAGTAQQSTPEARTR